MTCKTLGL